MSEDDIYEAQSSFNKSFSYWIDRAFQRRDEKASWVLVCHPDDTHFECEGTPTVYDREATRGRAWLMQRNDYERLQSSPENHE